MLCDFGCSQFEEADAGMNTRVGTRLYMPPELLLRKRERKYDHACDLWSLGVMSYVLLCGCPPFPDENEAELNAAIRAAKFDWPPWTDARASAKRFVRELLQVDPTRRPSADAALRHEWIVSSAARAGHGERRKSSQRDVLAMSASIGEVSVRMRRFTGMARLKKIALNTLARDVSSPTRESAPRDLGRPRALAGAAAPRSALTPAPPPHAAHGRQARPPAHDLRAHRRGRTLPAAEIQDALRETLEAAPDPAAPGGDAPASRAAHRARSRRRSRSSWRRWTSTRRTRSTTSRSAPPRARHAASPRAPDTAARAAAVPRGDDDAQHLPQEENLRRVFDQLDADNSSFISVENLAEVLGSADHAREVIAEADITKDGDLALRVPDTGRLEGEERRRRRCVRQPTARPHRTRPEAPGLASAPRPARSGGFSTAIRIPGSARSLRTPTLCCRVGTRSGS